MKYRDSKRVEVAAPALYSDRMGAIEPDHLRLTGYLRRVFSYFSADWLQIFLDLSQVLTQWIAWKNDGLYDILAYESTLDLADPQGKLATVRKHQRVRFLQNDVAAFQDIVYGDGQLFRHYKVSPGVAVDRYRDGDRWHVLISMRATKNRGDVEDFYVERSIEDGFALKDEWWEIELRHPTRWLRLAVIFPKERPCSNASITQRSRRRMWRLGPENFTLLPDGRQKLAWETKNVQPLEVYTVRWSW